MQQKLKNNEKKLSDWSNPIEFMKEMTEVFVNYDVYSNGKMTKLNQHQVHQG